ncbi:hypothetical protein MKY41_19485 [Sporosarcina sp. FSL W7-1349]|uniref:hypothetical protein n=1 Tax=Sporosarcina sp. FSL W7-1349 TaxID=2921561 RepID=UPI0030F60446
MELSWQIAKLSGQSEQLSWSQPKLSCLDGTVLAKSRTVRTITETVMARAETVLPRRNCPGKISNCQDNRSNCHGADQNYHVPTELSWQFLKLLGQSEQLSWGGSKLSCPSEIVMANPQTVRAIVGTVMEPAESVLVPAKTLMPRHIH